MKITMAHGSGGKLTADLIDKIFKKEYGNATMNAMEDCAVVDGSGKIAFTTDSFIITPLEFPGGDIGRLAVCGTVNDLLMRGAVPKYLTSAFIIEEGADSQTLKKIAGSMAKTAREAGVEIVAGDTKVTQGHGGLYINTAGVGFVKDGKIRASGAKAGDAVIVSGNIGDHHATVMSARLGIENSIKSDCAPLVDIVGNLMKNNIEIHTMRDITRGGLGTVLNEISEACGYGIEIEREKIPVSVAVKKFSEFLGLEVLHMGCEGRLVCFVPQSQAQAALEIIKNSNYGENAEIVGTVTAQKGTRVTEITPLGGKRIVPSLRGEGLPRIC